MSLYHHSAPNSHGFSVIKLSFSRYIGSFNQSLFPQIFFLRVHTIDAHLAYMLPSFRQQNKVKKVWIYF